MKRRQNVTENSVILSDFFCFGKRFAVAAQTNRQKSQTTKPTANSNDTTTNQTPDAVTKTSLPGGVEMSFAYIPPSVFRMGSNRAQNEMPAHDVKISQGFWMQTTEVSQAQLKAVMCTLPSKCDSGSLSGNFIGDNKPVICVSWSDAQEFVRRMNLKKDGFKYSLPTEAEWEYAARQGAGEYVGNYDIVGKLAWYAYNSGRTIIPRPDLLWNNDPLSYGKNLSQNGNSIQAVATKQANKLGLYDMRGNAWEWVQDWYHAGYYAESPAIDPTGPASGSSHVIRGGSWFNIAEDVRLAIRRYNDPSRRLDTIGFRILRR